MNNKKNGLIIVWLGFLIASIILFLDKNSGFGTYIGATFMLVSSLIYLISNLLKNNKNQNTKL